MKMLSTVRIEGIRRKSWSISVFLLARFAL